MFKNYIFLIRIDKYLKHLLFKFGQKHLFIDLNHKQLLNLQEYKIKKDINIRVATPFYI